jgi:hypothetical protein
MTATKAEKKRKTRVPTPTEAFVNDVAHKSFLSLWSYASPQGRTPGKELCDVLVVCADVIIFSVKEVRPKQDAPDDVRFARWVRGAVDESAAQIYGAERFIASGKFDHVIQQHGTEGLKYPPPERRRIHRVAVALGGDDHFPVPFGDLGKGFVHVFDRRSFTIITSELDTVTDFVEYLRKKEAAFSGENEIRLGREEDLLAVYLHGNRTFPDATAVLIEEDCWKQFAAKPEVIAKKEADKKSYAWDALIERIARDVTANNMLVERPLSENERVLRVMAHESRFNRRVLGELLHNFLEASGRNELRSRMIESSSGVGYVFLAARHDEDRDMRNKELSLRCFIARARMQGCQTIIGIGTEQKTGEPGASWDFQLLSIPEMTEEQRQKTEEISKDLGYFATPIETPLHVDEYPGKCPD